MLQTAGFDVISVESPDAALELCKTEHFDLLISDIRMPRLSGGDLLRELRSNRQNMAAIAVSGVGIPNMERQSRESGFAEHLSKPLRMDALRETVTRILQDRS